MNDLAYREPIDSREMLLADEELASEVGRVEARAVDPAVRRRVREADGFAVACCVRGTGLENLPPRVS
jgi:hypothetical protein